MLMVMINVCFLFQDLISDFEKFSELIETTIDLEEVENHQYMIRADFDSDLQECKQSMNDISSQFILVLNDAAKQLGLEAGKTLKLESSAQLGQYLRITLKVCIRLLKYEVKLFTLEKILNTMKDIETLHEG